MAGIMKLLSVLFFFLAFISQGTAQPCSIKNLEISQKATGKTVKNKTVWKVRVTNNCICSQLKVKLNCKGFERAEAEALSIPRSGNECTLTPDLTPLFGYQSLTFTYASDTKFPFTPIYSEIACS